MATLLFFVCMGWAVALLYSTFAVYQRRITWHCHGEQAITHSIVMQALAIFLQVPPFNDLPAALMYRITGQYNLEAFVGYGLALGSIGSIAYHFTAMIKDDDDLRRSFKRNVELPIILCLALMFAFLQSGAGVRINDSLFYLAPHDNWLKLYWLTFCITSVWMILYSLRGIRVVRHYPSSRGVMTIFLCASYSGIAGIMVRTVQAIVQPSFLHGALGLAAASVFGCGSMLLWTGGAAYSWARRVRWFTQRKQVVVDAELDADK
jgi:hypothetical protein